MKKILIIILILFTQKNHAQVGIGTFLPDASSVLDLTSVNKGILIPRMTTAMRNSIDSPALSLLIFNTDEGEYNYYNGAILGWQKISREYKSVAAIGQISTTSKTDIAVTDLIDKTLVATVATVAPVTAGSYLVTFNSQYYNKPIGTFFPIASAFLGTDQLKIDLQTAYNTLTGMTKTINPDIAASIVDGQTVFPGVYSISGAASVAGTLHLDAQGDPTKLFVFRIGGAFACGAATIMVLDGGAQANNVFWIAEGASSVGAGSTFKGTLIVNAGAVAFGASSTLEGRCFTLGGAITFGPATANIPIGTPPINLGTLPSLVLFSGLGAITNAGTSIINGDIGTDSGVISGFGTPTKLGKIFTPDSPDQPAGCGCIVYTPNNNPSIAKFGIFQNGNLIASSTKSLSCNGSVLDLSLQAIAKVTAGQSIDVKWNTDTEEIALGNRTLTITKVATGD